MDTEIYQSPEDLVEVYEYATCCIHKSENLLLIWIICPFTAQSEKRTNHICSHSTNLRADQIYCSLLLFHLLITLLSALEPPLHLLCTSSSLIGPVSRYKHLHGINCDSIHRSFKDT